MTLSDNEKSCILEDIKSIALDGGAITLEYFQSDIDVEQKGDESPVTIADQKAEEFILKQLDDRGYTFPIIAEESVAAGNIPDISEDSFFWLIDPLDGTKEFISGCGEYTVNIALVSRSGPVLGAVYCPAKGELYAGHGEGTATLKKTGGEEVPITIRPFPEEGLTVVSSLRHGDTEKMDAFLKDYTIVEHAARGSSLKICLIASGAADIYPRFGPTYEWDIAAGDAVLRSAGGAIYRPDGTLMTYGKERFWNAEFVATSSDEVF